MPINYMKLKSLNDAEKKNQFSVNAKPKAEQIEEEKRKKVKTTVSLSIIKWIFTVFLFFGTLVCLIGSKLSLVSLSQRLNKAKFSSKQQDHPQQSCKDDNCTSETAFVMVILIMMIPHGITFIKVFFNSAFSNEEVWPKCSAVLWVIFEFKSLFNYINFSIIYFKKFIPIILGYFKCSS